MSTNLITNYKNQTNAQTVQNSSMQKTNNKNAMPILNLKPLDGRGRLVKSNLFDAPAYMVNSLVYDAKSLKNGLKGKSNDHQLGKTNDIGMKLGGLAVATYLFTKKATGLTKGMELVGFGSFFASMALWPKIAFQIPAKLIHGFDIHQKYVDSQGRKKPVFQDRQYIPFDLYSDKEINKIGDRLGVAKDIDNRREFIQDKMKKIALQNNTMWMLTAGFATPIMSALICNAAEKVLLPILDDAKNLKADNMLANIEKYAEKYGETSLFANAEGNFNNLFEANKGMPITEKLIKDISKAITPGMDAYTRQWVEKDLKAKFAGGNSGVANNEFVKTLVENYNNAIMSRFPNNKRLAKSIIASSPTVEALTTLLTEKGHLDKPFAGNKTISNDILAFVMKNNRTNKVDEDIQSIVSDFYLKNITKTINNNPGNTFTPETKQELEKIAKALQNFLKESFVVDDYAISKVANAPETVLANQWNSIADSLPEIFNISAKEAESVRYDRTLVQSLIRKKMEELAAGDAEKYEEAVEKIAKKLAKLETTIKPNDIKGFKAEVDHIYIKAAQTLEKMGLKGFAKKLAGVKRPTEEKIEMDNLSSFLKEHCAQLEKDNADNKFFIDEIKHLKEDNKFEYLKKLVNKFGSDDAKNKFGRFEYLDSLASLREEGSLKRLQKVFVDDRLSGVKNAYYRLISTMDLYRRIAKENFGNSEAIKQYIATEGKAELSEVSKQVSLQGHCSDESIKYWFERSLNEAKPEQKADLASDYNFYKNSMKLRFENEMDASTVKALKNHKIDTAINTYRKEFFAKLGGAEYFAKMAHKVDAYHAANFEQKFIMCGVAIDEMFTNILNKSYNTKKWLKIFGGLGAGVLGVSVASQFLFGRMGKITKADESVKG